MIMIEIQYCGDRGEGGDLKGSMEPPFFDRPLTSLDQSHNHLPQDFITKHSLSLLFTVNYVILHLIRNKNNYR